MWRQSAGLRSQGANGQAPFCFVVWGWGGASSRVWCCYGFPPETRVWSIGGLFGCFGRKIDGPGLPGGLIIYQGHLFPLKGRLWLCHVSGRRESGNKNTRLLRKPCFRPQAHIQKRHQLGECDFKTWEFNQTPPQPELSSSWSFRQLLLPFRFCLTGLFVFLLKRATFYPRCPTRAPGGFGPCAFLQSLLECPENLGCPDRPLACRTRIWIRWMQVSEGLAYL